MLVIASPGQGAQTPGFLVPWLELPDFAHPFAWLSAVADLDLVHYGSAADAEAIRDTAVAQPLLVASGLASYACLGRPQADAVTGHSVGELTAAAIAGALTEDQALVLVRERGRAMAEAAAVTETGMTAVLGGDREEVLASLDRHGLTPANDNGPGQVVAAGTLDQLQALSADPPPKARLVPLSVAGAFHTTHMAPAVGRLETLSDGLATGTPQVAVVSNRDGQVAEDGTDLLARLVHQVSSPVRWDLCMERMRELGVTGLLELPPAGTLTGIARRALKGVATFALKTPDQLDDARAFCAEHASSPVSST